MLMLQRRILLPLLLATVALPAYGDQLAFTFIGRSGSTVVANSAAFTMGGSLPLLTTVTDTTTDISQTVAGSVSAHTGPSPDFTVTTSPNRVTATYMGDGPNSVLIQDTMGHTLLSGTMTDGGHLLSTYPQGTGAFLNDFTVKFVSPSLLALFNLNSFLPQGAFSVTFGSADVLPGPELDAVVGGGDVTIQASAVPEPAGYALIGTLLLGGAAMLRRKIN